MTYFQYTELMSEITTKRFSLYQGTVLSHRRWSDTHIWSSGGGGYVDPKFGGHVAAAQISSQILQKVEVFIKDDNGLQHALELTDVGVPITDGNKIIAVMDERWKGKPLPLYFENLDTRMFEAPLISTGMPQPRLRDGLGKGLFWGGVAYLSTYVLGERFFFSAGLLVYGVVGISLWWKSNRSKTRKKLNEFKSTNSGFLTEVQEVAKHNGLNLGLTDPAFGPFVRHS